MSRAWESVLGVENSQVGMQCGEEAGSCHSKAGYSGPLISILLGELALFIKSWQPW